jgi:hypothetical protein
LDRKLFIVMLVALFCLANVTRAAYRARIEQPRFAAEGAAHLRYTAMVAEGKPIPALDRRAQWPEGLRVFRETSPAMEYIVGWTYRLIPGRKPDLASYVRFFTAFFFSLAIVPVSLLSARLWKSLGAGILTALLFAAALPLVARSSGFDYIRENVALPLIAFHLFFYVSACAGGGAAMPVLSGVFLLAALASWQGTQFYLVPFLAFVLLRAVLADPARPERFASRVIVGAIAVAGAAVPFLREGRFLLSVPAALAAGILAVDLLGPRLAARRPGRPEKGAGASPRGSFQARIAIAAIAVAAVVLAGVVSGRHFASYSHFFDLVLYKLRYLRKPNDPRLLPFDARAFWVGPFNSPDALHFFVFALPILLLLPGPLSALVWRVQRREREAQIVLAFLAVFFFLFLLMQRLLPLFGFFAAIAAGGNVPLFLQTPGRRRFAGPAFLVSIAVVAVFLLQDFGWEGKHDYWRRLARTIRVPQRERFTIYPGARDVEGDLLAWIRGNVDPGGVVMSLHYLSPQVLTYTGRATNLNDFFESPRLRRKAERLLSSLYSSEDELYRFCAEQSSGYLLLSCAVGCDPTKDSPLYQAGLVNMPPGCAAYRLMFEPGKLSRFDLVYENEMYRLFRVGRAASPHLWPRSPLFYEKDLLWNMSGDIDRFYDAAMRIYALSARGRTLIAQGRNREGEQRLVEALRIFYFYPAWKALDELYVRQARVADRETAAAFAYRYDANRADVCLALAESMIARGSVEGVREILERCATLPATEGERALAGRLLEGLESAPRPLRGR